MFIILPLSHEKMQAQRLPYVTIGIIVFNVFLFIISHHFAVPRSYRELSERETEFMRYYYNHPYLDFPENISQKLPEEERREIEIWEDEEIADNLSEANRRVVIMREMLKAMGLEKDADEDDEALRKRRQEEQEHLNELARALEESANNFFYFKYGYVPSRGGFFTMLSSMFLHGGYLHLIFNMLFLWLSGCNIEDLWGRIVYPMFYLLGGVFATLAHGMMFPQSTVPLIGASGAIAAVMGAFMIRMYKTKIYFIYFILIVFRFKAGRFAAPAYVMLPLWLFQQLGEAFMYGASSGVAFWAHIGGFVFGAIVAIVIKVSGFEEKVLTPAIEKKVALVDEHLAAGIEKLQEDDLEGAIQELKAALRDNPDDVIAHGELSKAYFAKGDKKLALREFKRAVFLYIKRGEIDNAVDQYLELSAELPDMMLDPPQQMKVAEAIEQRAATEAQQYSDAKEAKEKEHEMYTHAVLAYKKLIEHYQKSKKPLHHPNVIKALTHYGDLCLNHLEQAQEALKVYQFLMQVPNLEPEQKKAAQSRIQQAKKVIVRQEKAKKLLQTQKKAQAVQGKQATKKPPSKKPKPDIPIPKRLKLVTEDDAPAKYQVPSVDPIVANKVLPYEGGLDLKRMSDPPILFENMYVICVFQFHESRQKSPSSLKKGKKSSKQSTFSDSQEVIHADLFLAGESRPYRIASNHIAYSQFFQKVQRSSLDNFRQFILYIISNLYSVYVDQATMNFLKTGKPRTYASQTEIKIHEKIFWKQLKGVVRAQCEHCYEVYWIDGMKVPKGGGQTQCKKCGKPMFVKPLINHQSF